MLTRINQQQRDAFKFFLKASNLKNIVDVSHLGDDISSLPELNMVSAIEIVEHFQSPMPWVDKILSKIKKGGFFCHSSYWQAELKFPTLGHFLSYNIDGSTVEVKKVNRAFTAAMKKRGYAKLPWDPYGHKPHFYYNGSASDWPKGVTDKLKCPGYSKL